jgi:hypothetical protein
MLQHCYHACLCSQSDDLVGAWCRLKTQQIAHVAAIMRTQSARQGSHGELAHMPNQRNDTIRALTPELLTAVSRRHFGKLCAAGRLARSQSVDPTTSTHPPCTVPANRGRAREVPISPSTAARWGVQSGKATIVDEAEGTRVVVQRLQAAAAAAAPPPPSSSSQRYRGGAKVDQAAVVNRLHPGRTNIPAWAKGRNSQERGAVENERQHYARPPSRPKPSSARPGSAPAARQLYSRSGGRGGSDSAQKRPRSAKAAAASYLRPTLASAGRSTSLAARTAADHETWKQGMASRSAQQASQPSNAQQLDCADEQGAAEPQTAKADALATQSQQAQKAAVPPAQSDAPMSAASVPACAPSKTSTADCAPKRLRKHAGMRRPRFQQETACRMRRAPLGTHNSQPQARSTRPGTTATTSSTTRSGGARAISRQQVRDSSLVPCKPKHPARASLSANFRADLAHATELMAAVSDQTQRLARKTSDMEAELRQRLDGVIATYSV